MGVFSDYMSSINGKPSEAEDNPEVPLAVEEPTETEPSDEPAEKVPSLDDVMAAIGKMEERMKAVEKRLTTVAKSDPIPEAAVETPPAPSAPEMAEDPSAKMAPTNPGPTEKAPEDEFLEAKTLIAKYKGMKHVPTVGEEREHFIETELSKSGMSYDDWLKTVPYLMSLGDLTAAHVTNLPGASKQ